MKHFVTLFNKDFLNRGIALYQSVAEHAPFPFTFWVLCLDDETYEVLQKLNLPNVIPVPLAEFENEGLKAVRKTRTFTEYCWTLGSWSTWYVLRKNPDAESVTYLDADLFFYSSLVPIYEAFEKHSVMIIPHRVFDNAEEREKDVGKYNVGMLIFRNDADGRACLEWWKDRCLEWCYAKVEPTRFGDQKYLDYFEEKFEGVYVLPWKGVNLAPWNIEAYRGKIKKTTGGVSVGGEPLIFFHFSRFKLYYPPSSWLPWGPPSSYTAPGAEKDLIYRPYAQALYRATEDIRSIQPGFLSGTLPRPSWSRQILDTISLSIKTLLRSMITRRV